MKISVVTPSYNQAKFIARTLESVARQQGAEYEHIVFDALSTDGSHEVIARYAEDRPQVVYRHEADRGQMHAINKGFAAATGEILTWINSDDYYAGPDVLAAVAQVFADHPDVDVVYGRGHRVDAEGRKLSEAFVHPEGTDLSVALQHSLGLLQPSLFFRRRVYEAIGGLDEKYNLQLDYEYWIRMVKAGFRFRRLDKVLSHATVHEDAKSTGQRQDQLDECLSLVKEQFGYVPMAWISRYAEFYLTRLDPKVTKGILLDDAQQARKHLIERSLAKKFNTDAAALAVFAKPGPEPVETTRRFLESEGLLPARRRIVVSSFDSQYFNQGLNLIASLHRTSLDTVDEILVYGLGLSAAEMATLESLERVRVVHYPASAADIFPGYLEPKHRAYKPMAIRSREHVRDGDLVLWMDAGLSALKDMREVFDLIEAGDFFMADHDDKSAWPFYNVNFMHWSAQDAFDPSNSELLAPHMCSCMVGHKVGGRFQHLIDEAFELGKRPELVMWPKTLPAKEKYKPVLDEAQSRRRDALLGDPALADATPRDEVRRLFPYYGHRTQSIYSILVQRYGAPRSSGSIYRRSNDGSSRAASVNWGASARDTDRGSSRLNLQGQDDGVVVYHHRGIYNNLNGLRYRRKGDHLFLMANGPSLRDAPFDELRRHATLGMNAAYRFWDENDFYPTYYCCLDTVVMESHKEEIHRLIRERSRNGIRKFFLREEMLAYYPDLRDNPDVMFLEPTAAANSLLALDKITTGSFSLLFGILLGYRNLYLMGVDLNYVEKLPEAAVNGRILEITEQPDDNPNYFFAGYQQKGDRYNPPNRHPNLHVRSWENIRNVLGDFPVVVRNLNPASALKCFEFGNVREVLRSIDKPFARVRLDVEASLQAVDEKRFWRAQLLREIAQCAEQEAAARLEVGQGAAAATLPAMSAPARKRFDEPEFRLAGCDTSDGVGSAGEGQWRLLPGAPRHLTFGFDVDGVTAGRTLVAVARLHVDRDLSVAVQFARRGNEPFEGGRERLRLRAGETRTIRLRCRFAADHRRLKLQFDVPASDASAAITIDSVAVLQALPDADMREATSRPCLIAANRLYREERYATALAAYLRLHRDGELALYGRNAMMCARKLSLLSVDSADQLLEHCR